MTSYAALIRDATETLKSAGIDNPARDARLLMRWVAGLDGAALSACETAPCPSDAAQRFGAAVARRADRAPLSHITGTRDFWDRTFQVTRDVLDPRPETECLVADALHRGPFRRLLDLGTGSGCIAISLLAEWPEATGLATDLSQSALEIARANAANLGVSDRLAFRRTAWLDGIEGPFDLVVSNPPYITADEMMELEPELNHEPQMALTPGGDGLDAYHAIARDVHKVMAPKGLIMLEIGPSQSQQVSAVLAGAGLNVVSIIPDLDQRPRVIVARV